MNNTFNKKNKANSQIDHWDQIPKAKWAPYKKAKSVTELFTPKDRVLPQNRPLSTLECIHNRVKLQLSHGPQIDPIGDIMNVVSDVDILRIGFSQIKKNKGALTPGSIPETADDFTNQKLYNLSYKLKSGTFSWKPVRRIYVEKPGKPEKRPLGLPDFEDKVVQAALRIALESIYEPIFEQHNFNYGFRPHKDPNGAIQKITGLAQGTYHAIEGDIKGAYNDVDHNILMEILQRNIKDKKFLNLIRSALKAGIMDEGKYEDTFLGIPQGGIVSPLLFNIYMHEFDMFVHTQLSLLVSPEPQTYKVDPAYERNRSTVRRGTRQIQQITDISEIRPDPFFEHCSSSQYLAKIMPNDQILEEKTNKIKTLINTDPGAKGTLSNWRTSYKKYVIGRLTLPQKTNLHTEFIQNKERLVRAANDIRSNTTYLESKPLKLAYIRYADDWVIFTSGDRETSEAIKGKVSEYLKNQLKLTLSLEKTRITHLQSSKVQFLGFEIYFPSNAHLVKTSKGSVQRFRSIQIFPDVQRLESRYLLKGLVDKKFLPRELGFLTVLTDHEIIRKYNQFMIGISNYYIRTISYPSRLNRWLYINYYSCLKTLATKHRITIGEVIKRYGFKDISNPKLNWYKPAASDLRITSKYKFNNEDRWEVLFNYHEVMCKTLRLRNEQFISGTYATVPTIDFLTLNKVNFRTRFKSETMCAVCNSPPYALHHIRPLKHKGGRFTGYRGFDKVVAALGRKQIAVCAVCHKNIHAGKYDGLSLDDLYDIRLVAPESLIRFHNTPKSPTGKKSPGSKSPSGDKQKSSEKPPSFIIDEIRRTYFSESLNNYLKLKNYDHFKTEFN